MARVSVRNTGRYLKCKIDGKAARRNIYETCFALPELPLGTEVVSLGKLAYENPRAMVTLEYFETREGITDITYWTR